MTTESESKKPRSIDELYTLAYSEMTEEEISIVVEYKAKVQAQSQANAERLEAIEKASQAMIEQTAEQYKQAKAAQDNLLNLSLQRLAKALE